MFPVIPVAISLLLIVYFHLYAAGGYLLSALHPPFSMAYLYTPFSRCRWCRLTTKPGIMEITSTHRERISEKPAADMQNAKPNTP